MNTQEIIKLLRNESNELKMIARKNIDVEETSTDKLKNYYLNLSEIDRIKVLKKLKKLKRFNSNLIILNMINALSSLINDNNLILALSICLTTNFAYNTITFKRLFEILSSLEQKVEGSYDESTKIDNIERGIEFLQSLTKEEEKKYLKLKI